MKKLNFMLALGIILALVLVPACSTSEDATSIIDIRGTWDFDIDCPGCYWTSLFGDLTFTGSESGGSAVFTIFPGTIAEDTVSGSWSVSGNQVNFQFTISSSQTWQFSGSITNTSSMFGTGTIVTTPCTWTATK